MKGGSRLQLLIGIGLAAIALLAFGAAPAVAGSAKLVKYRAQNDDPAKDDFKFFEKGGLKLKASCNSDLLHPGESNIVVLAKTNYDDSSLHLVTRTSGGGGSASTDNFDKSNPGFTIASATEDASGLFVYARPGGVNVSVKFAVVEDLGFDSSKDCAFFGIARVLDSSSSSRVNFRSSLPNGSGGFDTTGAQFDAFCDNGSLGVLGRGEIGYENAVIGYDHQSSGGPGFLVVPDFGPEDEISPTGSDNGLGRIVLAAPSGGPNVTIDSLAEDASGGDKPFGGTKECAWVGTSRTRSSGDAKRVNFREEIGTPLTPFFGNGGLILEGSCGVMDSLTIRARSTVDDAVISSDRTTGAGSAHHADPNFDDEDSYDLLASLGIGNEDATGQIVYSKPDGTAVTIDWMAVQGPGVSPFNDAKDCAFVGTAEKKLP